MGAPPISVIMNVRNGEPYLQEAIDSARAQTWTDWEMIVWDDCSTDGTSDIVARYEDSRIRYYLAPEETPLGPARDQAIRQARGEWLAFLDQDDVWTSDKLVSQLALLDAPGGESVALLYGRTVMFDEHGREWDFD